MVKCKWCKKILKIDSEEHGYGLPERLAKVIVKKGPDFVDYIEQAIHYVWKLNNSQKKQ